ncbi:MAG: Jag N-terminal domain-containing protein [Mollicutes bacterium]|nr:Jag N-terminal domain-containing protein [Mollicutes bacterium]MCI7224757.1 Jag N-terminal domain-containing protein [Mollicutes bacterium]
MREFSAKTVELCLDKASSELNVEKDKLTYEVVEEKKGFLGINKKATIKVYEFIDVVYYAEEYLKNVCKALGLEISLKSFTKDEIIKILIETNENNLLIGPKGVTLQSLNELVKLAVSNKFKKKYRILLDVHDYKNKKYNVLIRVAKNAAREVLKTHMDVKLNPMTPDERKKVHYALSTMKNIKTESVGDGKDRAIVIKYVKEETAQEKVEPKEE